MPELTEQQEVLKDKQVLTIQNESAGVVTKAENFQIISEETASTANNVLHWIAWAKKELEERRQFFVKPLNDHIKKINARFKELLEPLGKADGIIRMKVLEWRTKVEEKARKKEEEFRQKAEKQRQKEIEKAEAKGEAPPPPAPIPTMEVPKTMEGITKRKRAKILGEARKRKITILNLKEAKKVVKEEKELTEESEKEEKPEEKKKAEEAVEAEKPKQKKKPKRRARKQ